MYHLGVPKKVDHEQRRREITDAVCRITLRGGLGAATFREVAAEAGVSVRLVQYYFGTKAELLDTTQRHVGERSTARLLEWIDRTDGSARQVLGAFMKSFMPVDDESRTAGLMYIALYNEAVVPADGADGAVPRGEEANMMLDAILGQLQRGPLAAGVDPEIEARLLTGLTTGLGQYVHSQAITAEHAYGVIDYHLDRTFVVATDDA